MKEKVDFYISHSNMDNHWAKWVASCLEEGGYKVFGENRDISVGDNIDLTIHEYLDCAEYFIVILSSAYYASAVCQSEMSMVLAKNKNNIIPIKIAKEIPIGNLADYSYIDLYNVDENKAKKVLLKTISDKKKADRKVEIKEIEKVRFPGKLPSNNLSFEVNTNIFGGEKEIEIIWKTFMQNNVISTNIALRGIGGSGKTTIAKKYIQQYGYLYDLIWWFNGTSYALVMEEYRQFAIKQKLIEKDQKEEKHILLAVKNWMSQSDNWLFVFDNIEEYDCVKSFIPNEHKGHVLIITRNYINNEDNISQISIGPLSMNVAKSFLKECGIDEDDGMEELIQVTGNSPSFLKMAANYIKENGITIRKFLETDLFFNVRKNNCEGLISFAEVYKEQGNYLAALENYFRALKFLEGDKKSIDIYFNIATIYQKQENFEQALDIYFEVAAKIQNSNDNEYSTLAMCYNNIASIYFEQHRYQEAIDLYQKSLQIIKNKLGDTHSSVASLLHNISHVYIKMGEYMKAKECNYTAMLIREKIFGINHPNTAMSYKYIAELCVLQKEYNEALKFFNKAQIIYKTVQGEEHPDIASIYKKMGDIYQNCKEYDRATEFYSKAVQIYSQINYNASEKLILETINIRGIDDCVEVNIADLSRRNESEDRLIAVAEKKVTEIFEELKKVNEEDFYKFRDNYSRFISLILVIQKALVFDKTEQIEICHYSKLSTLKHIIKKKNENVQPKFRISNIAYLNDPSEGNILLRVFKKRLTDTCYQVLFGNMSEEGKMTQISFSNVFIGSFSTAKNKLPMWTLYGDDSKGCCLVFDDYFFDEKNGLEEITSNKDKKIQPQDLTLYKVKYIDIENVDETDIVISYLYEITQILNDWEIIIEKYESIKLWINELLDKIRFLFKDFDYDYENEVRVIIHAEEAQIKVDDIPEVPRLYVDLQRNLSYKEIILGAKIDKPVEIAPFLLHSGMVKKVSKSGIQYK